MPVDTSIYGNVLQPPRSALDYSLDYAKADQLRNANALQAMQLQQATNIQGQRNALQAMQQAGQLDLTTPSGQSAALAAAPDVAAPLIKTVQDGITAQAAATKDTAQAGSFTADAGATNLKTAQAKANQAIADITNLSSPQDAITSLNAHHANGDIDDQKYSMLLSTLAPSLRDPTQFGAWQRQMVLGIMDAKDRIAATAPKVEMANAGGSLVPVNTNADAGPVGPVAGATSVKTTVSPDTAATVAGENARAAAEQKTQLTIAGINPDGSPSQNVEGMAQAIAAGQMAPLSGYVLSTPRGQQVMARVMQINPQYDATTYGAKAAAAKAFTEGQQGNALRSISTANEHLSQLDTLGDALSNGNFPIVNSIGNAYGVQTGQAPAQVFNAVKNIVGQEVVKAIVASGGSAGERDEAAQAFSSASSPAQLKQTIAAYRAIMGAQQQNLLVQRRAAGLPDSTLPNYNTGTPGAGGAGAPGLPSPDAITAELQRRAAAGGL